MELRTDHAAIARTAKPLKVEELKYFSDVLGRNSEPLVLKYPTSDGVKSTNFAARQYTSIFEKIITQSGRLDDIPSTIDDLKSKRAEFVTAVASKCGYGVMPETYEQLGNTFDNAVTTLEQSRVHGR